jgi:hypothetical protein
MKPTKQSAEMVWRYEINDNGKNYGNTRCIGNHKESIMQVRGLEDGEGMWEKELLWKLKVTLIGRDIVKRKRRIIIHCYVFWF